MAKARKQPVKAVGRYAYSGSTRYTSKGSKKKAPRLKTAGIVSVTGGAASMAGMVAGGPLGSVAAGHAGMAAGRKISRNRGYVKRTKPRMVVRAYNKQHPNQRNAKTSTRTSAPQPVKAQSRVKKR